MPDSRYPPAPSQTETSFLSTDDAPLQIEGLLAKGSGDWGAVICHPHPLHGGNMRNKVVDTAFRVVAAAGGHALRFNYRGVGASEGTYGEGIDEAADLKGAIAHLREETDAKWPIWLIGFSFGTHVIAHLLDSTKNEDDIDGILLLAPPIGSMGVSHFTTPPLGVHMILGEHDEFCTPAQLEEYRRDFSCERVTSHVLPDTGHFFHKHLPALADWIDGHLQDSLPK